MKTLVLTLAATTMGLAACATMPGEAPRAPQPAKAVDAARFYTGVWREIGRRPIKLTDGCVAGTTTYQSRPDGRVQVLDGCDVGAPGGKLKTIGGPADIQDPGTNAKLRVHYRIAFIPITKDYWVLDHADDYSWFISADPTFKDLWIYTRDPAVSVGERDRLVARAKALGYDVTKLEFPAQPAK